MNNENPLEAIAIKIVASFHESFISVEAIQGVIDDMNNWNLKSEDEYRAWDKFQTYYDLYKDYNGIRPRHMNWFDNDANGWDEAIRELTGAKARRHITSKEEVFQELVHMGKTDDNLAQAIATAMEVVENHKLTGDK
jgi:hypothetical protein